MAFYVSLKPFFVRKIIKLYMASLVYFCFYIVNEYGGK